jgi:hypothetical protein
MITQDINTIHKSFTEESLLLISLEMVLIVFMKIIEYYLLFIQL